MKKFNSNNNDLIFLYLRTFITTQKLVNLIVYRLFDNIIVTLFFIISDFCINLKT